jgi:hypothetical protein
MTESCAVKNSGSRRVADGEEEGHLSWMLNNGKDVQVWRRMNWAFSNRFHSGWELCPVKYRLLDS